MRDEPRAGDVIHGRVPVQDLDPVTLAQLEAWFGAPSAFGDTPPPPPDPERDELMAHRAELLEAADLDLVHRIEALRTAADDFVDNLPEPPTLTLERPISAFDLEVWKLRLSTDIPFVERPDDIPDSLQERAPQAILRDLHRPERHFMYTLEQRDLGVDVGGERARTRVAEAMTTSFRLDTSEREPAQTLIDRDMGELRQILAAPWEHSERREDDAQISLVPTPNDMKWFAPGRYDPDV